MAGHLPERRAPDRPPQHVPQARPEHLPCATTPGAKSPVAKFRAKDYLDRWINPPEKLEAEAKKLRDEKAKIRHATPRIQRATSCNISSARPAGRLADGLSLDRAARKAYYFRPQGMTKVMNEGWACLKSGIRWSSRIVACFPSRKSSKTANWVSVLTAVVPAKVYDWATIRESQDSRIRTRRGFGSGRIHHTSTRLPDGTWSRLDEFTVGRRSRWRRKRAPVKGPTRSRLATGNPSPVTVDRSPRNVGLDIEAGPLSRLTKPANACDKRGSLNAVVELRLQCERRHELMQNDAAPSPNPARTVNGTLPSFLGYLVGDGNISEIEATPSASRPVMRDRPIVSPSSFARSA